MRIFHRSNVKRSLIAVLCLAALLGILIWYLFPNDAPVYTGISTAIGEQYSVTRVQDSLPAGFGLSLVTGAEEPREIHFVTLSMDSFSSPPQVDFLDSDENHLAVNFTLTPTYTYDRDADTVTVNVEVAFDRSSRILTAAFDLAEMDPIQAANGLKSLGLIDEAEAAYRFVELAESGVPVTDCADAFLAPLMEFRESDAFDSAPRDLQKRVKRIVRY